MRLVLLLRGPPDLDAAVARHLAPLGGRPRPWGWKHPHSLLLLPLLVDAWPRLRFVHVVRDGRDMAFSANRNQLAGGKLYGPMQTVGSRGLRTSVEMMQQAGASARERLRLAAAQRAPRRAGADVLGLGERARGRSRGGAPR